MGIVLKEHAEMFEINFVIFFLILGGAKGPGIFFIIPCTDSYQKVDLRTVSFDVPPQEVSYGNLTELSCKSGIYQERGPKGSDF